MAPLFRILRLTDHGFNDPARVGGDEPILAEPVQIGTGQRTGIGVCTGAVAALALA